LFLSRIEVTVLEIVAEKISIKMFTGIDLDLISIDDLA